MKTNNKLTLLILSILIALFVCYNFAIKNTIQLHKEHNKLLKEVVFFNNISDELALLNRRKRYNDSILLEMNLENTSIENNLLRILNIEASKNSLDIIDFNTPHIYIDNNGEVYTYNFTLQGGFIDIISTLHQLELNGNFGEVAHVNLLKKKNFKTNKDYLIATVFIQNFK
ncbi:hypothetical protein [Cellulophaga sp. Hel_I_12]|uniref:hypothetical protein n=1 Tax=Cellulophaga sp. Hel_I_12 TaxID=1249972 RepID=UPI0006463ED6|nr:hypothetical protein [Cellulophaga sp. Hel_I_12]